MIYKLEYKKIIILLAISFMIVISILWYKKEAENNIIPKRASFVRNEIDWSADNV